MNLTAPTLMPLSPVRNRLFVVAFVSMLLGLSVLAAVMITRGWKDTDLQRRVSQQEAERNAEAPRL